MYQGGRGLDRSTHLLSDPYCPLGGIGSVPRAYKGMKGRKIKIKNVCLSVSLLVCLYVFEEKTIYIVLTGTVIYIVSKQLKQWQSVSLETSY
jgi:hypothetical protein